MICPNCKADQSICTDTRQRTSTRRWRRYRCQICDARYSTEERIAPNSVTVPNACGEYVKMERSVNDE